MSKEFDLQPGDKILISRTDRIGDLVLALPFVETLKMRYPECRIEVMASLYASPLLENNKRIDRIVRVQQDQLVSSKLYKKDLFNRIKDANYKLVVALYPEKHVSRLFYKAGIPHRLGTAGRFHSVYFNHHIFHSRKENKKHESEYNLDFLKFFKSGQTVHTPTVYPKDRELKNARRILTETGVEDSFVVLHPGSGGSADSWPFENFVLLARELEKRGINVVVSGSDSEGERLDELEKKHKLNLRKIAGHTDLRTLAAVLSMASVVVANSTGPLHLAVAVGTKVVGLYPMKKVMSPVRWGPLGKGHKILVPSNKECQCPPKECQCMANIKVEKVADAVMAIWSQNRRKLK